MNKSFLRSKSIKLRKSKNKNDIKINSSKVLKILKKFNYKKKILYQDSNSGWKGDVSSYKYSTKKIKKLGYKFSLNSLNAIKKTISNLTK